MIHLDVLHRVVSAMELCVLVGASEAFDFLHQHDSRTGVHGARK